MRARQHQKLLSPQAASFLVEQLGVDLYRLQSELEKLAAYVGDREKIEVEDVKEAVTSQRSFTVFELSAICGPEPDETGDLVFAEVASRRENNRW